jgi:hypothetical protein
MPHGVRPLSLSAAITINCVTTLKVTRIPSFFDWRLKDLKDAADLTPTHITSE